MSAAAPARVRERKRWAENEPLPPYARKGSGIYWVPRPFSFTTVVRVLSEAAARLIQVLLDESAGKPGRPEDCRLSQEELAEKMGRAHANSALAGLNELKDLKLIKAKWGTKPVPYIIQFENWEALAREIETRGEEAVKARLESLRRKPMTMAKPKEEEEPEACEAAVLADQFNRALRAMPVRYPIVLVSDAEEPQPLKDACPHGRACALVARCEDEAKNKRTWLETKVVSDSDPTSECGNSDPPPEPWESVQAGLKPQLPPEAYSNWVARSRQIGPAENGAVRVAVHNAAAKDWLETDYRDLVAAELAKHGIARVEYEVCEQPEEKPPEATKPPAGQQADADFAAYTESVIAMLERHQIPQRIGQALDRAFVERKVASVFLPLSRIEANVVKCLPRFRSLGLLDNVIEDARNDTLYFACRYQPPDRAPHSPPGRRL